MKEIRIRSVLTCETRNVFAASATAAIWRAARRSISAKLSASSPRSRSGSPARSSHAHLPYRRNGAGGGLILHRVELCGQDQDPQPQIQRDSQGRLVAMSGTWR